MQAYLQSEMFLSNSVDMMKNLHRVMGRSVNRQPWIPYYSPFFVKIDDRESIQKFARNAGGTYGQGYITSGTHPTMVTERSTLTVCFKNGTVCPPSTCYKSIDIEVINCGSYYVHSLLSTDACAYAYCSE